MRYALHGLIVDSDLPLAAPPGDENADAEVTIVSRSEPVAPEPPAGTVIAGVPDEPRLYTVLRHEGGYAIHFPGRLTFFVDESTTRVDVRIDPAADPGLGAILATGNLFAVIFGLRGVGVLHASAVAFDDTGAIAIAGLPTAGKSTLSAMLCLRGGRLVTDDVLRIDTSAGRPICIPGSNHVRLRQSAAKLARAFGEDAVAETADGRLAVEPPHAAGPVPLTAVVLPKLRRDIDAPAIEALPTSIAASGLLGNPRVLSWRDQKAMRAQFEMATRVAACVPVLAADLVWDALDESVDKLLAATGIA